MVVQAQAKEMDRILVKLDQVKEVDHTPVSLGLLQDQIPDKQFKGQGQIWVKQGLDQIPLKLDLDQSKGQAKGQDYPLVKVDLDQAKGLDQILLKLDLG